MYKLSDFSSPIDSGTERPKFIDLVTRKWDEIYNQSDVFKYNVDNIPKKVIDGNYLLWLNPDRSTKRRIPEEISNIIQPFDKNKFNFAKVSNNEIIFKLLDEDAEHVIFVNVSPISRYHSVLCPHLDQCLPQVVTRDSLLLVLKIMFLGDRDLRIAFNSLCALASVNHLHYHLLMEKNKPPVEIATCRHLHKKIFYLNNYPIPGFCFEVTPNNLSEISKEAYNLLAYLLGHSIAHNIFITRGCGVSDPQKEVVRLLIWPRRSSVGAKQLATFNIAASEMSGAFPIFNAKDYEIITKENLEAELSKWKINDFNQLCDEIKLVL